MTEELIIKTKSLKDLLSLFDPEEEFVGLSLGDTWHPSSGFVDEGILKGKRKVGELLEFDYDFEGLIGFHGYLGSVKIYLITYPNEDRELEEYEISGIQKELRIINDKAIELNCYQENRYQVVTSKKW